MTRHRTDEAEISALRGRQLLAGHLAGIHLRSTLIRHNGTTAGGQINFSPLAPRAFFEVPAGKFAHRSYELANISRPVAEELHERANAAPTWAARCDAVDDVLMRILCRRTWETAHAGGPRDEVLNSRRLIARSDGGLPISLVADQFGWSRRYLNCQFRAEFGIGLKEVALVIRFNWVRRMISTQTRTLADIAAIRGYSDQPRLNRDFRVPMNEAVMIRPGTTAVLFAYLMMYGLKASGLRGSSPAASPGSP